MEQCVKWEPNYAPVIVSRFGLRVSQLLRLRVLHQRCAGYASLSPRCGHVVERCAMLWHVVSRQMNVAERGGQHYDWGIRGIPSKS